MTILLLFTMGIGQMWGAAPSALTYQTISSTTIIYTSPTNLAALGYVQDGKGTQTYSVPSSDRGNGLNPTDETKTDYAIGTNATTLKSVESNKSVYFYVKNVTKVEAYVKNNSSGDGKDRTTTIVATPTSGSALDGSVTLNGASGKAVVDGLDKDKNYTIVIHANGADMFLYAVRLTAATLTPTAPAITSPASDPDLQTITQGETKTFEVTATGYPAPTYQWYKNSSKSTTGAEAIAEATAASYTTPNTLVASADNYYFYCVATNSQGTAQSPYFSLKVNPIGADLTAHVPGVYESTEAGGYSASLITYNERQYETYYFYSNNSKIYLSAGNKAYNATGHYNLIDGSSFSAGTEYKAGWVAVAGNSMSSGSVNDKQFDINASTYYLKMRTKDTHKIRIKVSGYDQLAFYGKNNSTSDNDKKFAIKIDGITVANPNPSSNSNTIFAFDLTTAEHYIEITTGGSTSSDCQFQAISLRLPACTKPAAPTSLSCTAQTVNTLTFGWTKETNAVGYVAKLYSDSGCETEVDSKDLGNVNTVTFTGLSNSTTYYCKVQSKGNGTTYCEDGNVTAAASGATDAPSCGVVTAPTSLLVGATTADGAPFTIIDDADAYNYELYISESSSEPESSATATHTSTAKTKDVTGLTSGTTYYAWVRSVCDETHKSTWTAAGSSFKVRTNPTASFANATYIIGSGTLNMSTKFSSNSGGAVVYELKEATANAEITSAGVFSATVAGEYVVVANQAGNADYTAISKEATVTVLDSEISDIYVWKKNTSYGGDDKCISESAANVDPNANAAYKELDFSSQTMTGMSAMGRPAHDNDEVTLTFAVKDAYNSLFAIKGLCVYGKLDEAEGAEISWDNGTNWTAIAKYSEGKRTFDAPTGVYPTNFKIRFTAKEVSQEKGGLWWRNALVTLQAKKTVSGTVESLQNVKVNDVAISASDLTTLKNDKTLAISTEYAAAPTVTFVKRTTISYEGGWADDVVDEEIEVVASDASTVWSASQTINAQAYTVTLAKPTEPSLETAATSFTLTSTKNATDSKSFTFSGANLEHSVAITLASDVAGMSVSPANVIPDGNGAITNEEVTITYKSLENVAEANVNLIVSYSETVKLTIPLTYSSTRGWDTPNNVTGSITWDFSKAASSDVTISNSEVTVLANYDVENDPTKIVTDNLAGKGEKFSNNWLRTFYLQFTTTVNGRLAMEYSDTGSSSGRRTRYMYVNGVRYGTGSNTSASHTLQDPVYVTAGTITLTAKIDTEGKEEAQWNDANVQLYQMVFVQTHDITFVDGGSIPAIHAANGETVSLPDVDAGDVPAGMSFNGWFIGDTKIGNAGDDYTMGDEDVALTAKFRTACTTPTIAWNVQPTNSRSITGTQDVSVTLTDYSGEVTWLSSEPTVATISGTDENATITYVGEGSTTITAQFIIPDGQSLCDGTYKVTKEITLMDCPEPAALTNEIARFQVPACGIDHEHALTNEDVARDNCTVTVTNGVGGSSSNWSQISEGLWYAKFQSAGAVTMNVTGGFQEGDLIYVYLRAYNGQGLKLNKSEVEIKTTQNDGAEVALEYELLAADIETDGSIILKRVSSNTFVNRVIVVRPPCRATNVAWATEPAKAHVGDADGTATITTNYVTGVTYSSSNTDVATIAGGNGTNTVTIHYVAAGTTTITATVTGEDPFCTDPVSVSKEIRVIGDAPAYGTLYKFEVKEMADAYIFSENNASMEMTTDNYLSLLQSGELTASVSGGYNRLYISNNAFVFANSAGGQLTMSLDYPLAVGDVIKYKNVNGNNDRANLNEPRDAERTTVLSGNGGTAIQTFDVPAAWAGATELTLTRNNNNPKIAYFEVYRRPVATGVSLTNMTIRQGVSTTPVMTLAPTTDAIVNSQAWEIVGTPTNLTGAEIDAGTGAITTGTLDDESQNGSMTVKVTVNGTLSATCTITVIKSYVRANVSGSMLWDWTASCWDGQPNVELKGDDKDADVLMANTGTTMVCNDDFRSDMLVINGNYAWRLESTNKYFQGTKITIYPSVPGLMRVNFRAPSSGQTCTVKINGVTAGAHGNSFGWSDYVEVPANTTDGIAIEMTNSANGYTRVNKIEFLALEDRRAAEWVKPGELGTVCLKNDAKVVGATVYELNGANEHGYMVFDEITEGEIEAGKPYLFEATRTGNVSFYKKLNAGHADDPVDTKGMYGTFTGTTLTQGADNYYYFSGTHIWRVNDFTVSITIPAYCCYVDYDEFLNHPASTSPNPVRRRVVLGVNGTNTATGMENTEATDAPVKMMIDGQLFILRGEKLYDATGRLVK